LTIPEGIPLPSLLRTTPSLGDVQTRAIGSFVRIVTEDASGNGGMFYHRVTADSIGWATEREAAVNSYLDSLARAVQQPQR
jgi:hypothetical protein